MTKQEYMKRVGRKLECSPAKKSEILKQLDSHIEIALGEGRELPEIFEDMGSPEILAGEFNENLDEKERKDGRRGKLGRRILCILGVVVAVLAVLAGLVYWALPKARSIEGSKYFDAAQVQSLTKEVVELFSAEEYVALEELACEEMKEVLEKMPFPVIREYIGSDWGKLQSIGNIYMVEIHERNKVYATVQVNVSYDNVNVTFTLSFNRQMQLYGFFIK